MKSVMVHTFSQIPEANIPRSSFNRSHGFKATFNGGVLVPVFVDEALPGDTFSVKMTSFARLSTPIVPIMDNLFLESFFFAVPIRLIWDNWKKFNGEQINPGDSTDFLVPQMVAPGPNGWGYGTLSDYFGIPTGINGLAHSSLWHRAYNLIWNEWFRDENLQNSVTVDKGDGPDTAGNYTNCLPRGKRHDYFTSCLPWPQKGTAVTVPLGVYAPVKGDGNWVKMHIGDNSLRNVQLYNDGANNKMIMSGASPGGVPVNTKFGTTDTGLIADLSTASSATINALRQAFQIQRLYERDARGGTRYTEIVRSHFGVVSPDARLQRPEYLGGGSSAVNIHPVPQTSSTDATTPQGHLAAFGTCSQRGHGFTKSFTEHCILIGMVAARADLNYQQGLNRMFSRRTRWDFYWPALAHLGEQAVLNKEIYATNTATDDQVFGYQERYAEYRYKPSIVTGMFRSNIAGGSLDIWHLSQNFTALPVLNSSFIVDNPPIARVVAVPSQPHFMFDAYFDMKCARPMPVYSVPGLIDHL